MLTIVDRSVAEAGLLKVGKPRGRKPVARWLAVAVGYVAFGPMTVAQADQIMVGESNYPGAKIRALKEGRLEFLTADGELRSEWIDEVDLLVVDRGSAFADFNQAERYLAGGEPEKAIVRYRRTMHHLSEAFWSDVIVARLVMACDRAGRIEPATLNFVRLVRGQWSGPAAAARLIPREVPTRRTAQAARALQHVDGAIAKAVRPEERMVLELLRFEILDRTGDKRAAETAEHVVAMVIPESYGCERVFEIQMSALESVLASRVEPDALAGLDRAIRDCPQSMLPGLLLLKGQALLRTASSREDVIRASWPLMRVVIHLPEDPRAAEALYWAALAVERIGRGEKAIEMLRECLARKDLRAELRPAASAALERLTSAGAGSG